MYFLNLGVKVLKPWPNGTQANSSQVTNSKLTSAGRQTVLPSRARSRENQSIVSPRPCSHLTVTKQLGESWPRCLAKRWKSWLELGENLSLIKIQANSIQLAPSKWPNVTQLWPCWKIGWGWLELGVPLGQAFQNPRFTHAIFETSLVVLQLSKPSTSFVSCSYFGRR